MGPNALDVLHKASENGNLILTTTDVSAQLGAFQASVAAFSAMAGSRRPAGKGPAGVEEASAKDGVEKPAPKG